MFAYCGNNPVNRVDPTGHDWWHWAVAAAIVAVSAIAVVATAGGAAGAALAITAVANGVAVSSTATTVAAGVFVGSSTALAVSAYSAMIESNSAEEFAGYGEAAMYSTIIGGGVGGYTAYNLPGHNCFVGGTLVYTADGLVEIDSIESGDLVWAWDEETGDVALKEVVETYVNETSELVHIFVNGEEIITTLAHPFYSPVKGWTEAVRLRAGDILILVNGEYVVIEKVQHEILETPITVYNFQVKDYHTYYVANASILVHNSCNHSSQWDAERSNHWKDQGNKYSTPTNELSASGTYNVTQSNIDLMKNGYAPYGTDGYKVQLHHPNGIANDFYNYYEILATDHRGNYKALHSYLYK